jgi:hypothetical protein
VSIGIGDVPGRQESYLRLDYSPNALLFADNSEFNILQHFIRLEGLAKFGRLSLTLSQDVNLLEGTSFDFESPNNFGDPRDPNSGRNRDVSGRNQFELYATALGRPISAERQGFARQRTAIYPHDVCGAVHHRGVLGLPVL